MSLANIGASGQGPSEFEREPGSVGNPPVEGGIPPIQSEPATVVSSNPPIPVEPVNQIKPVETAETLDRQRDRLVMIERLGALQKPDDEMNKLKARLIELNKDATGFQNRLFFQDVVSLEAEIADLDGKIKQKDSLAKPNPPITLLQKINPFKKRQPDPIESLDDSIEESSAVPKSLEQLKEERDIYSSIVQLLRSTKDRLGIRNDDALTIDKFQSIIRDLRSGLGSPR